MIPAAFLLMEVYEEPTYRKVAQDFSAKAKVFSADDLIREVQRHQIINAQMAKEKKQPTSMVSARVAAVNTKSSRPCYNFRKGDCKRADCNFSHDAPAAKKPQCDKCGAAHDRAHCTFNGTCSFCHKAGHRETVCRGKKAGHSVHTYTFIYKVSVCGVHIHSVGVCVCVLSF